MTEIVELQARDFELIGKIERAFVSVQQDDGISWREAEEIDNHGDADERHRARRLDADEQGQNVPADLIRSKLQLGILGTVCILMTIAFD